jgi:GAF domain-containing protein
MDSPYKGLIPYVEDDAEYFFGRDQERRLIAANLCASRLTILSAMSGVGKSSVLSAGVAHDLRNDPDYIPMIFRDWRDEPLDRLADEARKVLRASGGTNTTDGPGLCGLIDQWRDPGHRTLLFILDQFEEYFQYHPHEEGEGTFAQELSRLVSGNLPANVLISIREDSFAWLGRFKGRIPNVLDNTLSIDYLDRHMAKEAILKPLEKFNARCEGDAPKILMEESLADKVLDEMIDAQPHDVLQAGPSRIQTPYLQLVMSRWWEEEKRGGSGRMRWETLQSELGGVKNIVDSHIKEATKDCLPSEKQAAAEIFSRMAMADGRRIAHTVRDLVPFVQAPPHVVENLLKRMVDIRVMMPVRARGVRVDEESYEFVHDVVAEAAYKWAGQHRQEELERMHEAAKAMAEASTLDQVLQTITERAQSLFQADSSGVWSYDDGLKRFIPNQLVATGIPDSMLRIFEELEPMAGGITDTVLGKELFDVSDVTDAGTEFIRPEMCALLMEAGIRSFEGIVLKAGEEPVAVLYVGYRERRTFTEADRSRLRDFATHAALSLKKAQLLHQLERANAAAHVVARVTALGDLKDTLLQIARETQDVLSCDSVVLFAYDRLTQKLDYPPTMVGVWDEAKASQSGEVLANSLVYKVLKMEEPYIAEDTTKDILFNDRRFARGEGIQTSVAIPLRAKSQPTGVMFVNYRTRHRVSSDEQSTIRLFAYQAAVAIGNAQLHERVTKRARALQAIHETGVVVTGTLELNEILHRIAEQAWHLAGCNADPIASASIWLTDSTGPKLVAAFPRETLDATVKAQGDNPHLMPQMFGRIGVIGRTIKSKTSQLVSDVDKDDDFVRFFPDIRQQLAVPMNVGDEVIGVISVENPSFGAFDKGDQESLECLAAQAAVAIQNARRFEDLRRIKGYVGSHTALEWMKMVSQAWAHSIRREVGTALTQVTLIKQCHGQGNVTEELIVLERLKGTIDRIGDIPIIAPLSAEDAVESVQINNFLKTDLDRLWNHPRYFPVKLRYDLQEDLDTIGAVRASRVWLRRLLEILVDNSVEAMLRANSPNKELTVGARALGEYIKVSLRDTGPGIPRDFLEEIFERPQLKPPGSRGAGIGLLLAATIVRNYGGDISVASTGAAGTTMVVVLPMEKSADDRQYRGTSTTST